jgi:hypothetical protein
MPNPTYTLISSQTLASNAAVIDFTSISQSYYDLRFHYSLRTTGGSTGADIQVTINGDAGATYRNIIVYNDTPTNYRGYALGGNAYSYTSYIWSAGGNIPTAGQTAGLFSNGRMLVPGYSNSNTLYRRSVGTDTSTVTTGSAGNPSNIVLSAGSKSTGAAVSRVTFTLASGYGLIAAGSTISLYGCTNT